MPAERTHRAHIVDDAVMAGLTGDAWALAVKLTHHADLLGRFNADDRHLLAVLWGRTYPIKDVRKWLREIELAGVVTCYERDGRQYGAFVDWGAMIRPPHRGREVKSVLPQPTVDCSDTALHVATRRAKSLQRKIALSLDSAPSGQLALVPETPKPSARQVVDDYLLWFNSIHGTRHTWRKGLVDSVAANMEGGVTPDDFRLVTEYAFANWKAPYRDHLHPKTLLQVSCIHKNLDVAKEWREAKRGGGPSAPRKPNYGGFADPVDLIADINRRNREAAAHAAEKDSHDDHPELH